MRDWKKTTLGEVVNLKRGYDLPNSQRNEGNIPIFSSSGITDFHNVAAAKAPGVITGRYGTIGQVFYANEDYWPLNTTLYVQDFKGNNEKFIYYFLKVLDFEKYSDKSAVPGVNRNDLHKEIIVIPENSEQTAIAEVLSSLDDKIDLLHRQNKTLEQLAETLFRQWFVEEAEESWEATNLGKIANFFNGKARPEEGGDIPVYGGNGVLGFSNKANYGGKCIIVGRVGAYCGSLYYENKDIWVSDNALLVKPKSEVMTHYMFYLLKTLDINSMAEGSSHPLITQTLLKSIEVNLPPDVKVQDFDYQVEQFREKIQANQNQIRTLTQLRDTLLPKLMSGEVRVDV
jgi:type I restriction enzyme, S subunit